MEVRTFGHSRIEKSDSHLKSRKSSEIEVNEVRSQKFEVSTVKYQKRRSSTWRSLGLEIKGHVTRSATP